MVFLNDTLSIVLVGDWNRLYIQPDWIAENVYDRSEIEIGVNGMGAEFSVSYRADNVMITPTQSKVMFTANNTDKGTLENMVKCINNFLERAKTPVQFSYGINAVFVEDNGNIFAEMLDDMSDTTTFIDNGYEVESTKIIRTLKKDGKIMNIDSNLENGQLLMHFNEHYGDQDSTMRVQYETLEEFIGECNKIVSGLGYELEGDV